MRNFYILLITISLSYSLQAQQVVFSRSDVTTGNFGDAQLPWFYATSVNIQGDPDNGDTTPNFVKIGHNNNTTMFTNGRFYKVATLDFEGSTTSPRTINNSGGGLSASGGIYNASPATHTFNTPVGIDGPLVQIHTNSSGGFIFTEDIFINSNTVQFGNLGTGDIAVSGTMSGAGNVQKVGSNNLIISGTQTYSGTTDIDAGTVILQTNLNDSDVTVKSGATLEIDASITVKSILVEAGGIVIINSGSTLTLTDDLTLESTSTSFSSLISDGTIVGTVNYNRHVNGNTIVGSTGSPIGNNDLISAPLSGQTFSDFDLANPNLLASGAIRAFAPFNKGTGTFVNFNAGDGTFLDAGVGYRAATDNTSTLTFTGTVNTGTITTNIINSGTTFADWNLIGNPYPSYINVQDFLNHVVGVDTAPDPDVDVKNIDLFISSTAAIYGYNGSTYDVYNLANTTPSTVMAPGQGFFVTADATKVIDYDVTFTRAMQKTGSGDDFIMNRGGDPIINLELQMASATEAFVTDFFFNAAASLGLDPGYDAGFFGNMAPPFAIYSSLVEDDLGSPYLIQTLGPTDYGNTTVSLGVNANQGEQLTFSISENSLPVTVEVYLDDSVANTSTLLNTTDYILTPNADLSGTGRFFLRFSDSALSVTDAIFDALNIYTNASDKTIVIAGQLLESTTANIYDLQGRLVTQKRLETNKTNQSIDTSSLSTGVYVIQLTSASLSKSQKIILR